VLLPFLKARNNGPALHAGEIPKQLHLVDAFLFRFDGAMRGFVADKGC